MSDNAELNAMHEEMARVKAERLSAELLLDANRARAKKAEAERDAATRRAMDAEEREANLQLGIEALVDHAANSKRLNYGRSDYRHIHDHYLTALRALLDPTPTPKEEA